MDMMDMNGDLMGIYKDFLRISWTLNGNEWVFQWDFMGI